MKTLLERVVDMTACVGGNVEEVLLDAAKEINTLQVKVAEMERLITWVKDECRLYPDSLDEKAFADRLLAAITHPKSGLQGAKGEEK